jgi:hypothetical protein
MFDLKQHLLSATLILLSTLSYAQVPNSFSSGETISSSQINANFSFLADAMARGHITGMMRCENYGESKYADLDNPNIEQSATLTKGHPVFTSCLSSDNTTFPTMNLCNSKDSCNTLYSNQEALTFSYLIENNWLLHLIDRSASNNQQAYYYFYKISDQ